MDEIENKVAAYKELGQKIEELEEQKKKLVEEILTLMPQEAQSLRVAHFQVKRIVRLSIKTTLEEAKVWDAIKLEQVLDKQKIKKLFASGQPIPNVSEYQYIQVSKIPETS